MSERTLKKLNLLRHHRKRKEALDDNENSTSFSTGMGLGLAEEDETFSLVDLLCDLVSRYTYMRINFLPLSSNRQGGNNFMFPKRKPLWYMNYPVNCQ